MAAEEEAPARVDGGPGVVVESRIGSPRAGDTIVSRDGPDGEGRGAGMTAEELAALDATVAAEEAAWDAGDPAPPAAELEPPDMGDVPPPEEEVAPGTGPRPDPFDHRPTEIDRSNVVVTMPAIGRNASRTAWKLGHVSRP